MIYGKDATTWSNDNINSTNAQVCVCVCPAVEGGVCASGVMPWVVASGAGVCHNPTSPPARLPCRIASTRRNCRTRRGTAHVSLCRYRVALPCAALPCCLPLASYPARPPPLDDSRPRPPRRA